ncbi:uncharacterized protein [Hyperolius riggenbachi]|uniref:uncharacterized protein isoform X5 n=1 Tax=Hyperolius riggenbachi TaxID=752182 RepID=UPI0035A28A0D
MMSRASSPYLRFSGADKQKKIKKRKNSSTKTGSSDRQVMLYTGTVEETFPGNMEDIKISIVNEQACDLKRKRSTAATPSSKRLRSAVFKCSTPSSASWDTSKSETGNYVSAAIPPIVEQNPDLVNEWDDSLLEPSDNEDDSPLTMSAAEMETLLEDDSCYAAEASGSDYESPSRFITLDYEKITHPGTGNATSAPAVHSGTGNAISAPAVHSGTGNAISAPAVERPQAAVTAQPRPAPRPVPRLRPSISIQRLEETKNKYYKDLYMHIMPPNNSTDPQMQLANLANSMSRDQSWQHPSNFYKRNKNPPGGTERCTLSQWAARSGPAKRFQDIPRRFQRSPIPAVLPF